MATKTIGILGCGWLGLPLGKALIARGYAVKGSTTGSEKKEEIRQAGIVPYELRLSPELEAADMTFFAADMLVVNIPPGRRQYGEKHHPQQAQAILEAVRQSGCHKLIYISATSVYANGEGVRVEEDVQQPGEAANKALAEAEALFLKAEIKTCVLRLGGLMGYDRIPAKYAVGREQIRGGNQPVNYVHRDDVIRAILKVVEDEPWGEVFNVVAPAHPTRRQVYEASARETGYHLSDFDPTDATINKIVSSEKIIRQLGFTFHQPDPVKFPYEQKSKN